MASCVSGVEVIGICNVPKWLLQWNPRTSIHMLSTMSWDGAIMEQSNRTSENNTLLRDRMS